MSTAQHETGKSVKGEDLTLDRFPDGHDPMDFSAWDSISCAIIDAGYPEGDTAMAMKTKVEIMERIRSHKDEIEKRFTVRSIGLFRSYAHGTARPGSDVDIAVEMGEPTFDHCLALKFFPEGLFGAPVDLVPADTIKPRLKPYIDRNLVHA